MWKMAKQNLKKTQPFFPRSKRSHIVYPFWYTGVCTKHIKNATWPEGCGQRNEKTRKRENQKTEKTRKREIENQKTGTLLAVFGFSSFSPFSGFRRFRVFPVFAVFLFSPFSPFSRPQVDSSRFRVFGFSRFRVHRCFHMFSPGVFVLLKGPWWLVIR